LRPGEVLGATWDEIDLNEKLWVIPGERMKACKTHKVPLSAQVLAIIAEMQEIRVNNYVFPGSSGGRLGDGTLLKMLRLMKLNVTGLGR
jgi:integrase